MSVISFLGIVLYCMPEEGITVTIKVPSLKDALKVEQFISKHEVEVKQEEDVVCALESNEKTAAIDAISGLLSTPAGDYRFFDDFFEAAVNSGDTTVRVAYYGDSQIEEDRMSSTLRDSLQNTFGGGGVGILPVPMSFANITSWQWMGSKPPVSSYFHDKEFTVKGACYGPCLAASRVNGQLHVKCGTRLSGEENRKSALFNRVVLLADNQSCLEVLSGNMRARRDSLGSTMTAYRLDYPDSTSVSDLRISGDGDLYGVMLDADTGLQVDNFSIRGSGGTFFTDINRDNLRDYLTECNVKMIVLQFACNQMLALRQPEKLSRYGQSIRDQIVLLKELAPEAAVLFVGLQDMSYYSFTPSVVDTLKKYSLEAGAAYYDMYNAMGGKGSMKEWNSRGLAGTDGVHFTKLGASTMASYIWEALYAYYDYYRWRTEEYDDVH